MGHTYNGSMKEDKYHGFGKLESCRSNLVLCRNNYMEKWPEGLWRNENGQESWQKHALPVSEIVQNSSLCSHLGSVTNLEFNEGKIISKINVTE